MFKRLKQKIERKLLQMWQEKTALTKSLRPLSWFYCSVIFLRRLAYRLNFKKSEKLPVPVIIVGNLTVGGTGKTPLVIWMANFLKENGFKPGIISRGYGGKARHWPQQVRPDSDPVATGDEAVLIARRTNCPMAVGPERIIAGKELLHYHPDCNVIVSDDGLQHLALDRDIEIVVVDGTRRFGNEYCLPAGPLREPVKRISKVDFVVTNGVAAKDEYAMKYLATHYNNILDENKSNLLEKLKGKQIHALAGIGNPDRFFKKLNDLGAKVIKHDFPDHYMYAEDDLQFEDKNDVVMTEKDAVKCKRYADKKHWFVPITAELQDKFGEAVLKKLKETESNGSKTT